MVLAADSGGGGPLRLAAVLEIDCSDEAVVRLDVVFMEEDSDGEGGGEASSYDTRACASTQSAVRSSDEEPECWSGRVKLKRSIPNVYGGLFGWTQRGRVEAWRGGGCGVLPDGTETELNGDHLAPYSSVSR